MSLIIPANTLASGGFSVDNSCRFDDGSSAYMHKTPGGAGNRQKFTFSCWVKKTSGGTEELLSVGGSTYTRIGFEAGDEIKIFHVASGSTAWEIQTVAKYRDPSAWYNFVFAFDTTQGTASNRIKLYVNGVRVEPSSGFGDETYPNQNYTTEVNNAVKHRVGIANNDSSAPFDGYMSEVVLIDGQQLAPTEFGEFNEDSGIWKPIDVSGLTFGTNGFYLDFEDSANLGNDANGGTDLTEVNLTAIDQSTDTCTNNFATLNPLDVNPSSAGDAFTEGNLKLVTNNNSNAAGTRSNIAVSSGKWYAEVKYTSATAWNGVAAMDVNFHTSSMGAGTISWYQGRTLYVDGSNTANWGSAVSAGDIVGIALDMDNSRVTISQGGQWWGGSSFNQAQPNTYQALTSGYDTWGFMCRSGSAASTSEWNFGSPPFAISSGNQDADGFGNFEFAVPSGYFALCTKNLAEYG